MCAAHTILNQFSSKKASIDNTVELDAPSPAIDTYSVIRLFVTPFTLASGPMIGRYGGGGMLYSIGPPDPLFFYSEEGYVVIQRTGQRKS